MEPVRIVVVDDDDDIRRLLSLSLPRSCNGEVVGSADSPDSAIDTVARLQPDVIVTDLVTSLTVDGSSDYLDALRESAPEAKVVVFSGRVRARGATLPAGVDAYIEKSGDLEQLGRTILAIVAGSSST